MPSAKTHEPVPVVELPTPGTIDVAKTPRPLEERLAQFNAGMRALTEETGLTIGAMPYMDGDAVRMRVVAVEVDPVIGGSVEP